MDKTARAYVTDRRTYGANGARDGGGWMIVRDYGRGWEDGRIYWTKREAETALRAAEKPASHPVYAVPTGTYGVGENWERMSAQATSKTAAIKAVRAAGYRVRIDGGLVELTPGSVVGVEGDVWTVTVHG